MFDRLAINVFEEANIFLIQYSLLMSGKFPFVVFQRCQRELELRQTFALNAKLRRNKANRFELKLEPFELS